MYPKKPLGQHLLNIQQRITVPPQRKQTKVRRKIIALSVGLFTKFLPTKSEAVKGLDERANGRVYPPLYRQNHRLKHKRPRHRLHQPNGRNKQNELRLALFKPKPQKSVGNHPRDFNNLNPLLNQRLNLQKHSGGNLAVQVYLVRLPLVVLVRVVPNLFPKVPKSATTTSISARAATP